MNLNADSFSTLQVCKRRFKLEQTYRVERWKPKRLLERVLRKAIFDLSRGQDVIITRKEATAEFMSQAARPGLETPYDPYTLAKDYCAIIENVLEYLSRTTLLYLNLGSAFQVGETEHVWQVSAFQDESGVLHRWAFVEKWDEDTKYKEFHSWHCFGDCAAAEIGMVLHVVEIGRTNKGHVFSDWTRTFKHPAIHNYYKFRKQDGSPLDKSWSPVWYQDSDKNTPKGWVDLMVDDGINLIHHISINEPKPEHVKDFHKAVEFETSALQATSWKEYPLNRPACDLPLCPWQTVCYGPSDLLAVDSIGGYAKL